MPREKIRKRRGLQIAADPLPAGGDTGRHSPKKSTPVSSPYEKGKSPHKLAMKDGWKENEIKGTTKGKKKGDVKLPNIPKAKKKKKRTTAYT